MYKKLLIVLCSIVCCMATVFGFTACSNDPEAEHTHTYTDTVTAPTCTDKGYTTHYCAECGESVVDTYVDALGHSFTKEDTADKYFVSVGTCVSKVYYYSCERCGEADTSKTFTVGATEHSFVDYAYNNDATCSKDGTQTATCANGCNNTDTIVKEGSKTTHNYVAVEDSKYLISNATCTAHAVYFKSCSYCGEKGAETFNGTETLLAHKYETDESGNTKYYTSADGHYTKCTIGEESTDLVAHTPSGTTTTSASIVCTVCNYEIEAHIHADNLTAVAAKQADCVNDGNIDYWICECGHYFIDAQASVEVDQSDVVITGAHNYTTYTFKWNNDYTAADVVFVCSKDSNHTETVPAEVTTSTVEPTCDRDGKTTYIAKVKFNGRTYTDSSNYDVIEHTGHNYEKVKDVTADCQTIGYTIYKCSKCDSQETRDIKSKTDCTYQLDSDNNRVGVVTTPATCSEDGVKTFTCTVCRKSYTEKILKINHEYESSNVPATCTENAYTLYTCMNGCNDSYKVVSETELATGHTFAVTSETPSTCYSQGEKIETCSNDGCEKTIVTELELASHNMLDATCTAIGRCQNSGCTYTTPMIAHNYSSDDSRYYVITEPTCYSTGYTTFTCTICNEAKVTGNETAMLSHTVSDANWQKSTVSLKDAGVVDASPCAYKYVYTGSCENTGCTQTVTKDGDTFEKHAEVCSIKSYATCTTSGEKLYKCKVCSNERTETYSDETAHTWNTGLVSGGITTYTCENNSGHQKTAFVTNSTNLDNVSASALTSADSVELGDTSITLDENIKNSLSAAASVSIGAASLSGDDLNEAVGSLTTENGKRVNTVYSITMSVNGDDQHELSGTVTVRIPYTLSPGEDPEDIAIGYINGDKFEVMQATYQDGYAVFETEHFSFYTVTLMTASERCSLWGHNEKLTKVVATCFNDGYEIKTCLRCSETLSEDKTDKLEHIYPEEGVTTAATCTQTGYITFTCDLCKTSKSTLLPALGHNFVKDEDQSVDATCYNKGTLVEYCTMCNKSKSQTVKMLDHDYDVTETPATCIAYGYTTKVCKNEGCDDTTSRTHTVVTYTNAPTGHTEITQTVLKTCIQDGYVRKYCDVCKVEISKEITGTATGIHTYTDRTQKQECEEDLLCSVCGTQIEKAKGHTMVNGRCSYCGTGCKHEYNTVADKIVASTCTEQGYDLFVCTICNYSDKQNLKELLPHEYGDAVVVATTCSSKGYSKQTCKNCGDEVITYSDEELLAHEYVNGICKNCGVSENLYYYQLLTSVGELDNAVIKLSNLQFVIQNYENEEWNLSIGLIQLDVAELQVALTNSGIQVLATGAIGLYNTNGYHGRYVTYSAKAVLDSATQMIYVNVDYSVYEESVFQTSLDSLKTEYTDNYYYAISIDYLAYELFRVDTSTLKKAQPIIDYTLNTVLPKIKKAVEYNKVNINDYLEKYLNIFFTRTKTANGYVLTFDFKKLQVLNSNLETMGIDVLIDNYFGDGAFDALEAKVLEILNLKVGKVLSYIENNYGISADDLVAIVNYYVRTITGSEKFDVKAILSSETYADVTIGKLLTQIDFGGKGSGEDTGTGYTISHEGIADEEGFSEVYRVYDYNGYIVGDFATEEAAQEYIDRITNKSEEAEEEVEEEPEEDIDYEAYVKAFFEQLRTQSLYEMISGEGASSITSMVNNYILLFKKSVSIEIATDSVGNIASVNIVLNNVSLQTGSTEKVTITATLNITADGKLATDLSGVANEVKDKTVNIIPEMKDEVAEGWLSYGEYVDETAGTTGSGSMTDPDEDVGTTQPNETVTSPVEDETVNSPVEGEDGSDASDGNEGNETDDASSAGSLSPDQDITPDQGGGGMPEMPDAGMPGGSMPDNPDFIDTDTTQNTGLISFGGNTYYYEYYDAYKVYRYLDEKSNLKFISTEPDCGDWVFVRYGYKETNQVVYVKYYSRLYDEEGNLIYASIYVNAKTNEIVYVADSEDDSNVLIYTKADGTTGTFTTNNEDSYTAFLTNLCTAVFGEDAWNTVYTEFVTTTGYYNTKTGKFADVSGTQHDYVVSEELSSRPTHCEEYGYEISICKNCGKKSVYTYQLYHQWIQVYLMKDGATSCEGGADDYRYCLRCGKYQSLDYTNRWHQYIVSDVTIEEALGNEYVQYTSRCVCGEENNGKNKVRLDSDATFEVVELTNSRYIVLKFIPKTSGKFTISINDYYDISIYDNNFMAIGTHARLDKEYAYANGYIVELVAGEEYYIKFYADQASSSYSIISFNEYKELAVYDLADFGSTCGGTLVVSNLFGYGGYTFENNNCVFFNGVCQVCGFAYEEVVSGSMYGLNKDCKYEYKLSLKLYNANDDSIEAKEATIYYYLSESHHNGGFVDTEIESKYETDADGNKILVESYDRIFTCYNCEKEYMKWTYTDYFALVSEAEDDQSEDVYSTDRYMRVRDVYSLSDTTGKSYLSAKNIYEYDYVSSSLVDENASNVLCTKTSKDITYDENGNVIKTVDTQFDYVLPCTYTTTVITNGDESTKTLTNLFKHRYSYSNTIIENDTAVIDGVVYNTKTSTYYYSCIYCGSVKEEHKTVDYIDTHNLTVKSVRTNTYYDDAHSITSQTINTYQYGVASYTYNDEDVYYRYEISYVYENYNDEGKLTYSNSEVYEYNKEDNYCEATVYTVYSSGTRSEGRTYTNHAITYYIYSLVDGVTNCNDGVIEEGICYACGETTYTTTYKNWGHYTNATRVYMEEYGSQCGGYIVVYKCPCGYKSSVDASNIDGDITSGGREYISSSNEDGTSNGMFDHYIITYSCSVTDTAEGANPCGFVYTYEHYYTIDSKDCHKTYYNVYTFGQNEDKQYKVEYESDSTDYSHNTTSTNSSDNYNDGTYYNKIYTTTSKCSRCGKLVYKYIETLYYKDYDENSDNNIVVKSITENIYYSVTVSGQVSSRTVYEYTYVYDGDEQLTSYKKETDYYYDSDGKLDHYYIYEYNYVYNYPDEYYYGNRYESSYSYYSYDDGVLNYYWIHNYEYDWYQFKENGAHYLLEKGGNYAQYNADKYVIDRYTYTIKYDNCEYEYVTTTTNYDDEVSTSYKNYHRTGWCNYYVVNDDTCTQKIAYCYICGDNVVFSSLNHRFVEDSERGVYVCYVCGMESSTGVNGNVTMEDLTEKAGYADKDLANYVIGYYFNIDKFNYDVEVALYVDGGLVPLNIKANDDGKSLIYVSVADVKSAISALIEAGKLTAEQAENAMLRIAIVPSVQDKDKMVDYAVTRDINIDGIEFTYKFEAENSTFDNYYYYDDNKIYYYYDKTGNNVGNNIIVASDNASDGYYVDNMYNLGSSISFIIYAYDDIESCDLYFALANALDQDLTIGSGADEWYIDFFVNDDGRADYTSFKVVSGTTTFTEFMIKKIQLNKGWNKITISIGNQVNEWNEGEPRSYAPVVDYMRIGGTDTTICWYPTDNSPVETEEVGDAD